jgi:hypothetical protein
MGGAAAHSAVAHSHGGCWVRGLLALFCVAWVCADELVLSSHAIPAGGTIGLAQVYQGFGCVGGNKSPDLAWHGEPAGTQSFALTVFDPDAPTGHGWWHWLVLNLPAGTHGLATGSGQPGGPALPVGAIQWGNDLGRAGYGGPCPPSGDKPHRYVFTVWALRVAALKPPSAANGAAIERLLAGQVLAKASITAYYGR